MGEVGRHRWEPGSKGGRESIGRGRREDGKWDF